MVKNIIIIICWVFLLLVSLIASSCGARPPLDQVTLQLNWFHAAEFIGYYIADYKGYYRDSNVSVKIMEGGPGIPARDFILDSRADLAIASFDEQKSLLESGKPSVAVMTVFQIPPLVMFSLSDSGIKEPKDMVGKKIGIKNDYWRNIEGKTLTNAGIDPSIVIEISVAADAQQMLYNRQVDVWMGYAHDEPVTAEVAGYRVTNIYPADYGVGGYEGLLLTNESAINRKPELMTRFVIASQKGLQYAMEHPDEAALVLTKWQPNESLEYAKLAVRALIPLVDIPQSKIGWIDAKKWEQLMGISYNAQHPGYNMQFLARK